jgi:hypothetical protein
VYKHSAELHIENCGTIYWKSFWKMTASNKR